MDKRAQLADLFQRIGNGQREHLFVGVVKEVDRNVCKIEVDGLEIEDVRLQATTDNPDAQILITPAKDSNVLVGDLSGELSNLCVLSCESVDKIYCKIDQSEWTADKSGIKYKDDKIECTIGKNGENGTVAMKIGSTSIELSSDGIKLNGGTLGGLIQESKLVLFLNQVVAAVNTLVPGTLTPVKPGDLTNLKVTQ